MDKSLLQIGGLIAIIIGVFYSITIIGLILGVPMIIGGVAFTNYAKLRPDEVMYAKNSILGWSIFFLIFSLIPGILGIIYYLGMIDVFSSKSSNNYIDELKNLKELLDSGAITKTEFETKKKQILSK